LKVTSFRTSLDATFFDRASAVSEYRADVGKIIVLNLTTPIARRLFNANKNSQSFWLGKTHASNVSVARFGKWSRNNEVKS